MSRRYLPATLTRNWVVLKRRSHDMLFPGRIEQEFWAADAVQAAGSAKEQSSHG
jgi:hypothetical protein